MPHRKLRLSFAYLLVLIALGCSESNPVSVHEQGLTERQRAWCLQNPHKHAEGASLLSIRFIGDYIRSSGGDSVPQLEILEPPFLAIPSGNDEPLSYRVQFETQRDSDAACGAALDIASE